MFLLSYSKQVISWFTQPLDRQPFWVHPWKLPWNLTMDILEDFIFFWETSFLQFPANFRQHHWAFCVRLDFFRVLQPWVWASGTTQETSNKNSWRVGFQGDFTRGFPNIMFNQRLLRGGITLPANEHGVGRPESQLHWNWLLALGRVTLWFRRFF